jgi:hypothetical protein
MEAVFRAWLLTLLSVRYYLTEHPPAIAQTLARPVRHSRILQRSLLDE